MAKKMEKALIGIIMATYMMENGKKIKKLEKEFILIVILINMKVIFIMI